MRSRDVLTTIESPVPITAVLDQQQTINKVPHPKHVFYKPRMDRPCAKCLEFDDQKISTQPCLHGAYNLLGVRARW